MFKHLTYYGLYRLLLVQDYTAYVDLIDESKFNGIA